MGIYLGEELVFRGHEEIRPATSSTIGGVKPDGTTTSVAADGTLSIISEALLDVPVNVLETSGTIALTDNSVNSITPSGNVTFTLPSVTDNAKFHQILVQINMSTARTFSVGTTYFFNKKAPDFSTAGVYNLIYEYDKANGYWVCGLVSKGTAS